MKFYIIRRFIYILFAGILFLWLFLNFIFIPRILVPNITRYTKEYLPKELNLKIGKIYFNPFTGFSVSEIKITGDAVDILYAGAIDIDFFILPIFTGKMSVKNIDVECVVLNIEKNKSGKWNIYPLFSIDFSKNNTKAHKNYFDILLKNVSVCSGKNVLINETKCDASFIENEIKINEFSGRMIDNPFIFKGGILLGESKEISLAGKFLNMDNNFKLKLLPKNKTLLDWQGNAGGSYVMINGESFYIGKHYFSLNINAGIQIEDIFKESPINGKTIFAGGISGEIDKMSTLNGNGDLRLQNVSIDNFNIEQMSSNVHIENGILEIHVPHTSFCGGDVVGIICADLTKETLFQGLELNLEKVDLAQLGRISPYLAGAKGVLTGKIVYAGNWKAPTSCKGGGYIDLMDAGVWDAPVFSQTKTGVDSVVKGIDMPDFDCIKGNYRIDEGYIVTDTLVCSAKNMNMYLDGKLSFSGDADFTVGVKLRAKQMMKVFGFFKPAAMVANIGFNMITNCVKLKVKGKIPNMETKTEITPLGWLAGFFTEEDKIEKERYTLKKLLGE